MPSPSNRRRSARLQSGQALLGAFASTIRLLRWLLLALVGVYLTSGITRVGPSEDALVYRLGKLQREVHPPGLLFALPTPFDRVVRVPTRTQHELFLIVWSGDEESMDQAASVVGTDPPPRAETPARNTSASGVIVSVMPPEMAATIAPPRPPDAGLHPAFSGYSLTGDANLLQAGFLVRYRIVDPLAYVGGVQPESVFNLIEMNVFDVATRQLAGMKVDDALGAGLEGFRSAVLAASRRQLAAILPGIELVAFEVNTLTPPQAAAAAFADVTSAQVQARTLLEQARTYRAQILPAAQGEAFRIRSQATAEARQLQNRATAEASSFAAISAQHRANPSLIETRLRAETLEAVLPQVKTITVLPSDDATLDLFLPASP